MEELPARIPPFVPDTVRVLWWSVSPKTAKAIKVLAPIPSLVLAGWLFQNFLQLRGVVDLLASRIDLAFLWAALFVVVYALTVSTKRKILSRSVAGLVLLLGVIGVDWWAPKPQMSPTKREPAQGQTEPRSQLPPRPEVRVLNRQMLLDETRMPRGVRVEIENYGGEARVEATDIVYFMDRKEYSPTGKSQTQLEEGLWQKMLNGNWKPTVLPTRVPVSLPIIPSDIHHGVGPKDKRITPNLVHQLLKNGRLMYFIGAGREQSTKKILWQFCFYYDNDDDSTSWNLCSAGHNN
jgi:hypothetical protein